MDAITNLILQYIGAKNVKHFNEEEERGVIKFLVYLIDKWEEDTYVH